MEGKLDGMYMNHREKKHYGRAEEEKRGREAGLQCRRDGEKSTGNNGNGKSLTLSSQM